MGVGSMVEAWKSLGKPFSWPSSSISVDEVLYPAQPERMIHVFSFQRGFAPPSMPTIV